MTATTTKSAFWRGFRDGFPFILGAAPFGLLFGVLATEAGLNVAQVMSMGVLVIAGASQFTALSQMQENAPVIMVLALSLWGYVMGLTGILIGIPLTSLLIIYFKRFVWPAVQEIGSE